MLLIRTDVYPHMPIAITASGGQFVTCASRLPGHLSHLANDFQCIINFSLCSLGGANAWAKVHQKGQCPASHLNLPSYKISSPSVNPRRRHPLPKILRTTLQRNKQWMIYPQHAYQHVGITSKMTGHSLVISLRLGSWHCWNYLS